MKKILVCDDEPDVTDLVKGFLEFADYTVLTANRAVEALQLIELEIPRVVLMDVVMPDMDGLECLKKIKKAHPDIIVIMVSGIQDEDIAREAIRYGAYDYLTKPFDFNHLRDTILARLF